MSPLLRLLDRDWPAANWRDVNVAVAISGGADSTALLRALADLKNRHGGEGRLFALHVDHQVRGAESDGDSRWCDALCDSLVIPLQVVVGDPRPIAAEEGDGLEAAARQLRYRLLAEAAEQGGARYLATAHTQDDQVETVLFRMLRGSGLRGLAGIPRRRALSESVTLIRPMLSCSRAAIGEYLASLGQNFRLDSSNQDQRFTRNRLRHDLLPHLREQYNADLDTALLGLAAQAADAQQVVEAQARELLSQSTLERSAHRVSLSLTLDHSSPTLILCEALRIVWRDAELPERDMTRQWWLQLAKLAADPAHGEILNLPGNVRASNSADALLLEW